MVSQADDMFDSLVEEFIRKLLRIYPLMGTYLGLHQYDTLVPDLSRDALLEWLSTLKELIKKFECIDPSLLTGSRVIDYPVILNQLKKMKIPLEDWPVWRMYPIGVKVVGEAVFPIIINDWLPQEHKVVAITSRLRQIDMYLSASIRAIDVPYALWLQYSIMVAQGLVSLMETVKNLGKDWGSSELTDAAEKAKECIVKSIEEVRGLISKAEPGFKPIGRDLFEELLKLQFINESAEELKKIGYEEARKYRALMERAAKEMGVGSIEEGLRTIKGARIGGINEFMRKYEEIVREVRVFIYNKRIVELPEGENVKLVKTPDFMRPVIPFAAYLQPELFGPSLTGIYFVTQPLDEEMLSHHNIYDVINTVVHEAYPGHHTQLVISKLMAHPRRAIINAVDLVEGWAHYCEELMLEEGIERSPHYKLKVWHDALWRAVRVYLDVELHTEGLSYDEGVKKLMRDAYLPEEGARGEVLRYTLNPTYPLMYNYGKRVIKSLREEVKKILGPRYSHSLFHRLLLEEGDLPTNILRKVVIEKAKALAQK